MRSMFFGFLPVILVFVAHGASACTDFSGKYGIIDGMCGYQILEITQSGCSGLQVKQSHPRRENPCKIKNASYSLPFDGNFHPTYGLGKNSGVTIWTQVSFDPDSKKLVSVDKFIDSKGREIDCPLQRNYTWTLTSDGGIQEEGHNVEYGWEIRFDRISPSF